MQEQLWKGNPELKLQFDTNQTAGTPTHGSVSLDWNVLAQRVSGYSTESLALAQSLWLQYRESDSSTEYKVSDSSTEFLVLAQSV